MKRFGWIPDFPDHRDLKFEVTPEMKAEMPVLPHKVDLRPLCPPVYDQGDLGSCTANAVAGAVEVVQKILNRPDFTPSRLKIYYDERAIEGTVSQDAGATIRDSIKAVCKGVCPESEWPYDIKKFTVHPPLKCYSDAAKHPVTAYYRIKDGSGNDMLSCLASGYPFCFGFSVYDNFPMDSKDGVVPMPEGGIQGGHAVLAVGYDLPSSMYIVRNSWGKNWGLAGYMLMPRKYVEDPDLASDFWQILREK